MRGAVRNYDPYEPGPIVPAVKMGQNLGVFTQGSYRFYRCLYIEPLPPSRQLTQDIGSVGANANSAATEITVVNALAGSLHQVRAAPLDDFEAHVTQVRGTGRFITNTQQARIMPTLASVDPYYVSTTMFILGNDRQVYVTAYNQTDYALGQTRLKFWGIRYVLDRLNEHQERALQFATMNRVGELEDGGAERLLLKGGLTATIVPAEGREA